MQIVLMVLVVLVLVRIQAWWYKRHWEHGLEIDIRFSAEHAVEGDRLYLTEVITNAKLLPLPWLQAKFQISANLRFDAEAHMAVGDGNHKNELFHAGPNRRITRTQGFICAQRGLYSLRDATLTAQDLLMTRRMSCVRPCHGHLIVYPAAVPFEELEPAYRMMMGTVRARRFIQPDPFEFRGIRGYEPTDSLRDVNHKASAKQGELMVNLHAPTTTQNVTLWLNTQDYATRPLPRLYESGIRLAAAFGERFLTEGLSFALKTGAMNTVLPGTRLDVPSGAGLPHLSNVLEALALLDLAQPPADLIPLLSAEASDDDVHILISTYDGEDLQAAVGALREKGAEVFWILPLTHEIRVRVSPSRECVFWYV